MWRHLSIEVFLLKKQIFQTMVLWKDAQVLTNFDNSCGATSPSKCFVKNDAQVLITLFQN